MIYSSLLLREVVVGTDNLDLPAFVKLANASPTMKFCVLEYEGDVENPVSALRECVEAVRRAASQSRY